MVVLKLGIVAKMEWPGTRTQDHKTKVHSALPMSCASADISSLYLECFIVFSEVAF
jgi:hypothetical protein